MRKHEQGTFSVLVHACFEDPFVDITIFIAILAEVPVKREISVNFLVLVTFKGTRNIDMMLKQEGTVALTPQGGRESRTGAKRGSAVTSSTSLSIRP